MPGQSRRCLVAVQEEHKMTKTSDIDRGGVSRRALLRLLVVGAGGSVLVSACTPAPLPASTPTASRAGAAAPSALDALEKAARAEGALTWYTAVPPPAIAPLVKTFTDTYGIQVNVNRQTSGTLGTLLKAEIEGGKVVGDVIEMGDSVTMQQAADKGWLLKPSASDLPSLADWPSKWAYLSTGATYAQSIAVYSITYNSQLVGSDVPNDWKSLANPKWRGKLILGDPRASTQFLDYINNLFKQYGADFIRSLGDQQPQYTSSLVTGINSVASGDAALMAPGAHWINTDLIDKGAPVADAYPLPAMSGSEQWIGLVNGAPHPNAAALFVNFALSTAGQTATCKDLCSSVLNPPGTLQFPATYASPDLKGAVDRKDELLGLLKLQ
jgi:iron(III) transport system substrate-binding protein